MSSHSPEILRDRGRNLEDEFFRREDQRLMARLKELGVPHKLVVREGKAHGWPEIERDVSILAAWFDEHLKK